MFSKAFEEVLHALVSNGSLIVFVSEVEVNIVMVLSASAFKATLRVIGVCIAIVCFEEKQA